MAILSVFFFHFSTIVCSENELLSLPESSMAIYGHSFAFPVQRRILLRLIGHSLARPYARLLARPIARLHGRSPICLLVHSFVCSFAVYFPRLFVGLCLFTACSLARLFSIHLFVFFCLIIHPLMSLFVQPLHCGLEQPRIQT